MGFQFRWATPLGLSAALFLGYAVFCVGIAVGGPIYLRSRHANQSLLFHREIEHQLYGVRVPEPALVELRRQLMDLWCGFVLAVAALQIAVTWFALRRGERWALWTLALSDAAIVVYYFALVLPPVARVAPIGFSDIHPFAWVPALMLPPAVVLGWIGLR